MPGARRLLLIFFLALALAPAATAVASPSASVQDDVQGRLREHLGLAALARMPGGLRLTGTSDFMGEPGRFELLLTADGRFRRTMTGPLPRTWAWDGEQVWERDWTGMPSRLDLEDREEALLTHWGFSGLWLVPDLSLERSVDPAGGDDGVPVVRLRLHDGIGEARLRLGEDGFPAVLEVDTSSGTPAWRMGDWRERGGFHYPGTWRYRAASGLEYEMRVEEAAAAPAWLRDPFAMPETWPRDLDWDRDASPALEVRRAPSGHLLVRARLGDGEPRWFIFDTGAGSEVLDAELAADLGLEAVGHIPAQGIGGTLEARFRRGSSLDIGPVHWQEPVFVELDLQAIGGFLGVELAGILGYGLLSRVAAEVDTVEPAIRLLPPDSPELPASGWWPMLMSGRNPAIRARFEGDREAVFKIDTGSTDDVAFHAPAVERLGLLEGRETKGVLSGGVGGLVAARQGTIAWFEIGGRRFTEVPATFSLARRGAFTNAWVAGTLGGGIMGRFRVVYDYRHRRIALLPRGGDGR